MLVYGYFEGTCSFLFFYFLEVCSAFAIFRHNVFFYRLTYI
jgi:hypothetical protein